MYDRLSILNISHIFLSHYPLQYCAAFSCPKFSALQKKRKLCHIFMSHIFSIPNNITVRKILDICSNYYGYCQITNQ